MSATAVSIILGVVLVLLGYMFVCTTLSNQKEKEEAKRTVFTRRRRSSTHNLHALRSRTVRILVQEVRTGRKVNIQRLLKVAVDRDQWMVAYEGGKYMLQIGDNTLCFDVVHEHEFDAILSHRWHPVIHTDMGTVPVPMLGATYSARTWVDFINHFNEPEFFHRVLIRMGSLYAAKSCRGLYFEGHSSFPSQVEACSRAWMWQELSLGRQQHQYNSIKSVWLHHVVAVGDVETLTAVTEIGLTVLRVSRLSVEMKRQERFPRGRQGTFRRASEALRLRLLLTFLRTVVPKVSPSSPDLDQSALLEEWDLATVLQHVLGNKLGRARECGEFIEAMCAELEGEEMSDQLWKTSQTMVGMMRLMLECVRCVFEARGSKEATLLLSMESLQKITRVLVRLQGEREIGMGLTTLAIAMLLSGREGTKLSSALANLGNKNVLYDSDRLPASFGVLAATKRLQCEPPSVAQMVQDAQRVNVTCLPRKEACGVAQIARKRVHVRLRGCKTGRLAWVKGALQWLFSGVCMVAAEWEEVCISGMQLSHCFVLAVGQDVWQAAGWLDGWGEVSQYTLLGDAVVHIKVWMDCGYLIRIGDPSTRGTAIGQPIRLCRRLFKEWHAMLDDG